MSSISSVFAGTDMTDDAHRGTRPLKTLGLDTGARYIVEMLIYCDVLKVIYWTMHRKALRYGSKRPKLAHYLIIGAI